VAIRLVVVPVFVGVAVLSLSSCTSSGPAAPQGVFIPRLTGAPPQYGAAAIEGTLVESSGCLELTHLYLSAEFASPSPGAVVLVLWPEGSKAARIDGGEVSVDAPDLSSAVTGERLFVGGAFISAAEAEQRIGEAIPADCRVGLYWVATPVHS
jgi:hypothetical protein